MEDYQLSWQNHYKDTITISKSYFEHLLNCLANQKYINESPCNGDARYLELGEYKKIQIENQAVIDKAWNRGMFVLTLDNKMDLVYKQIRAKYVDLWNNSLSTIEYLCNCDMKKYSSIDAHIDFKYSHLLQQEIEMWIRTCCYYGTDKIGVKIDLDNETYTHGQVTRDDFEDICKRRGFTPSMKMILKLILVKIGIGENLIYVEKQL
jgi:hypothetical protein